jgi:hypothetical protein
MAVIFYSIDSDLKAVEFSEVTGNKTCIRVLFFCASEWVLFFGRFSLLLSIVSFFTDNLFWCYVDMNLVRFSNK